MVSEKELRQAATEAERSRAALHTVEGLALVMLCSSKPIIRKQAVIMLKEARNLFTVLNVPKVRPSSHYQRLFVSLRIFTVRVGWVRHSEGPPLRRIETKLGLQVGLA